MQTSLFFTGIFLTVGTMASAGCDNFEDGMMPNSIAPQYRVCFDNVCDVTQLVVQCENDYELRQGFANGWATFYTLAPTEWFSVAWRGRPIAKEELSRLTFEEMVEPDRIPSRDSSLVLLSSNYDLDYRGDCLPVSEFEVGGIKWEMPVSALIADGMPVVRGNVIPDFYGIEKSSHDGLDILIQRDVVVEVVSTDPQWLTPSGLRTGLTRDEVYGIFGRAPQRDTGASQTYQIRVCAGVAVDDNMFEFAYLVIAFGSDQRVEYIGVQRDWP